MQVTRTYPSPIDDVWTALTVSDRLGAWFGTYAGTPPTVEVTITGEVDAGGEVAPPVTATIHECVAPTRLVVEMPEGDVSWTVALDLAATPSGTVVELSQDLPEGLDQADIEAGWAWYLDRLGAVLTGTEMPEWVAPG